MHIYFKWHSKSRTTRTGQSTAFCQTSVTSQCLHYRWWSGRLGFKSWSSHTILIKWYLMLPCLTLTIIKYKSRVKWSNPGKGIAPSPTLRCRGGRYKPQVLKRKPLGHPWLRLLTLLTYLGLSLLAFYFYD